MSRILANRLPHEIELDRKRDLLKRVRLARGRVTSGEIEVTGKKPHMHYSWVNVHPDRVMHFETLGYEVCRDPDVVSRFKQEDNSHRRFDLVLMQCTKEWYEALESEAEIRAIEGIESPKQEFRGFAEQNNVSVHDYTK